MKKLDELATVTVEVLPPTARRAQSDPDATVLLKKLVREQVAEIMANRSDFVFQPFFQSAKVSNEIKRLQTIPEQRSWARVFERHGCIVCERRDAGHGSCGCCTGCYRKIRNLKLAAIREIERELGRRDSEYRDFGFTDDAKIARQAFARPMKALPPAKSKTRARRAR